jgi:hypothetical protein
MRILVVDDSQDTARMMRIPHVFNGHFAKPVDLDGLERFLSRVASQGRTPRDGGTELPPTTASV